MKGGDLRVSFLIAAAWLLGIATYSMLKAPSLGGEEVGVASLLGTLPAESTMLSADAVGKHSKLPVHWAHQRWGAV